MQRGGWTEDQPTNAQGVINFPISGVNVILVWSPAGDQAPLNFLVETYNILRASQPDFTFQPITEGEITISGELGIYGGFTTSDASGTTVAGGLIATWLCSTPGTGYRLTVTGIDSVITQIRFDRLVENFTCGSS